MKLFFILTTLFVSYVFAEKLQQKIEPKYLIVTDIVANIRAKPVDATTSYAKDNLQETQVLFNESLIYKEETNGWFLVECIEQQEFNHNNKWEGYPGWVKKSAVKFVNQIPKYNSVVKTLNAKIYSSSTETAKVIISVPMGVRFEIVEETSEFYKITLPLEEHKYGWIKKSALNKTMPITDKTQVRQNIIATATQLLGTPYFWGGRSPFLPQLKEKIVTGVDCSGFTSLSYRANNIIIPRDAHEQWMVSTRITNLNELQPADLIFISKKDNYESIGHVMLYVQGEMFLESDSPGSENYVKYRTFQQKFGKTLKELEELNFIVNNRKIYFGRIKELE
ncbi:MAG: C40 family peptidase [Endomicrobia bacterium]|nr:C40 family peptidase [Endomicrobiia bacterium]